MALAFVFISCKNDSSETEEEFTQLTKEEIDNSENWLKGEWYGEIQTFDVQVSETLLKEWGITEEEFKTEMILEENSDDVDSENKNIWSKIYAKILYIKK